MRGMNANEDVVEHFNDTQERCSHKETEQATSNGKKFIPSKRLGVFDRNQGFIVKIHNHTRKWCTENRMKSIIENQFIVDLLQIHLTSHNPTKILFFGSDRIRIGTHVPYTILMCTMVNSYILWVDQCGKWKYLLSNNSRFLLVRKFSYHSILEIEMVWHFG